MLISSWYDTGVRRRDQQFCLQFRIQYDCLLRRSVDFKTMMSVNVLVIFVASGLFVFSSSHAQVKTGYKTSHAAGNSGENATSWNGTNTYYDYNHLNHTNETRSTPQQQQQVANTTILVDAVEKFLNRTKSAMGSGHCYKEVPTASLVDDETMVPAGNGSIPTMSRIQVCCPGYQRNEHIYRRCDPICKDGCPNGICAAPNTCICIPGHVRGYENKCIPACPIGCGNGECQSDGSCKCDDGYTIEPLNRKYCVPFCSKGCQHGTCTAPDVCQCNQGYRLNADGICEPKCENCDHGTCVAPGVCNCNQGYQQNDNKCEPICSHGCNRGMCVAPEKCSCRLGFELDGTGWNCVPHCDQPCLNGYCDGDNVCACNSGYVPDETRPNICRPHCAQGCANGICSGPNFCICRAGFRKTGVKGKQECTPVDG